MLLTLLCALTASATNATYEQTDVITETFLFSVYESQTETVINSQTTVIPTYYLTYVVTNLFVRQYQEGVTESSSTTASAVATLSIPSYFEPLFLGGISFGVVFLFGFLYTSCCVQTELVKNPLYNEDTIEISSELEEISDKKSKKSKKSKKGKEPKSSKDKKSKKSKKSHKHV